MKFKIRFPYQLVASLMLGSSSLVFAQGIPLSQAIQEALNNSPRVKQSEAQAENAHWKHTEAMAGHMPNVSATANYLTTKKYLLTDISLPGSSTTLSMPQIIPTSILSLNAQLPIFDGFATTNRVSATTNFSDSSDTDVEWQKFQLEREVILAFYKAIAAEQLNVVAKQNLRTLEDHLHDVKLFKSAGLSTQYDVLRVEVQTNEARSEVMNTDDNLQMARNRLAELMGKENDSRIPQGQLPTFNRSILSDVNQLKDVQRKDFSAMQLRIDGLDKMTAAARKHWSPKISLVGQYQYYNNVNDSPTDRSAFRNAYTAGVALTWVLFDGLYSTSKVHESVAEKSEMELVLAQKKIHAHYDLDFWRRKLAYYIALYDARTSDIGKSQESVRLAQVGQKAGARTNTDLLDAESELFRARAGSVNAQIGSIESMINLELATGKQIYKF